MGANALDVQPGACRRGHYDLKRLTSGQALLTALGMKERPVLKKRMPHPGRLEKRMDGIPNFLVERHSASLLLTLHETLGDVDLLGDLAAIPHIFDSEREEFADAKTGMHSRDNQRDIAGAIAPLASIEQADDFIFAQRSASCIIHARKIQFPLKAAGFREFSSHRKRNRGFYRKWRKSGGAFQPKMRPW